MEAPKHKLKPMEYATIEAFKDRYILEKAQYYALKEDYSYYDTKTSNIDGTLVGEKFDNEIRLHVLERHNPEFVKQLGIDELDKLGYEKWLKDKQRSIEKYGEPKQ